MRRYHVVFTSRAKDQIDHLFAYVAAESGEAQADRLVTEIIAACMTLDTFPERGTRRDDIRAGLRIMRHRRQATIAFSTDALTDTVAIHGVFYGGQNLETALRQSDGDEA